MTKHRNNLGVSPNLQTNLFDDEESLRCEIIQLRAKDIENQKKQRELQGVIDKQASDNENLQNDIFLKDCRIETLTQSNNFLEKKVAHLSNLLSKSDDQTCADIRFTLSQIICCARTLIENKEIIGVKNLLSSLLRYIGTPADYEQVDSLDAEIKRRVKQGNIFNVSEMVMKKEMTIENNTGPIIENKGNMQTALSALENKV